MPSKRVSTPYDDQTYQIIGGAMEIHRELGPGYREDTYQRDLEAWFTAHEVGFEAQRLLEVYDSSQGEVLIGYYIPDFIVGETVVVEIKALKGLDNSHLAQVIGYLAVAVFAAMLGLHSGLSYDSSRSAIATSLGTMFFLFIGIFICMMLMVEARASFALQFTPFLMFILGGSLGLYASLTARNP